MTEFLDRWDGDIVRALRFQDEELCELAANKIEELRAALKPFANLTIKGDEPDVWAKEFPRFFELITTARAALEGK